MVKQLSQVEFNKAINSSEPVLVDFFASWCGPCRMLAPIMEDISNEHNVYKINVDEEEELARQFNIMSIPCVICFKDGKEISRMVGFGPKEEILKLLK